MDFLQEWRDFLFPLAVFMGLFFFRYLAHFRKGKALKEVAPYINGEAVINLFSPPRIQGAYMGMPFQMSFLPMNRNSPGRLQLTMEFAFAFNLELSSKGRMPGIEHLFTRGKAIETGEETFDSFVQARAEKEYEKAVVYLDNPGNREAVLAIFQEGFELIQISEKGVILTKQGDFLDGLFTQEMALRALSLSSALMQRI